MFYLVGVNHSVQIGKDSANKDRFVDFISTKIKDLSIDTIAEEWNENANELWKIKSTVLKQTAEKLGVDHLQFEPTPLEMKERDIPTREDIRKKVKDGISLKTVHDIQ